MSSPRERLHAAWRELALIDPAELPDPQTVSNLARAQAEIERALKRVGP